MPPSPVTSLSKESRSQDQDEEEVDLTRLPKTVIPKRYELKLDVYPDECRYTALVNIRLYFYSQKTNIIWLHSLGLKIKKASIRFSQFALPVEADEIIHKPAKECIGIRFHCPIEAGARAWLTIEFQGELTKHLEGFFVCPFQTKDGQHRNGAITMFAATEARTCFPCFDEPEFKAIFSLEVTVAEDLLVLSNMPVMDSQVKTDKEGRRRRTDFFEWTKEMSTYLVCIVIGDYEFLETKAAGRTTIRVYTPWGQREQGRFALEVSKKCLEFFNDYFGKRYPLPKLDLVAVSRLSVGAMENWGIIVCRETGLITDYNEANPATLQNIATLLAHEISHQWFGNLVTPKWWDGLYLNEGFATLMQYICIDKLYPKFEVFNRFCSDTMIPALGLDALQHSHPIEMPLEDSSEISQVFDKITYCKAASVIYMLHEFMGEEAFKEGLQNYISDNAYDNTTTEDLWHYFTMSSNRNVAEIMNCWIRELGFPVINVRLTERDNDWVLFLYQERFSSVSHENRLIIWSIPLKGIYMDKDCNLKTFEVLFDQSKVELPLENYDHNSPTCWVKLNPKLTGFYRVHYGEKLFQALLNNLDSKHLTPMDRIGLFDDQVAMVLSEDGSTVRILKMVQLFKDFETSVVVWKSVCGILHQVRTLTWPIEDLSDEFDEFCRSILRPVLSRLGYTPVNPNESSNDTVLRAVIFSMLACLGDEMTVKIARELFKGHVDGVAPLPPSIKEAVFRAVMTIADQQILQQMLMLYRNAELAEDRGAILQALGNAHDPNILTQVLDFALSENVQPQEAISVIASTSFNRYGYRLTWNFFSNNLDKILDRYLGTLFLFPKLVKCVTESFCDEEGFKEVSDFLAENQSKFHGSEHAIEQAEEHLKLNVYWRQKDLNNLKQFLDSYFKS